MTFWSLVFQRLLIFYFALLTLSYLVLNASALFFTETYMRRRRLEYELPRFFSGLEPWVSIVVPAFNEEQTVVRAMHALLQLFYPHYEVIVVNDGSNDNTLEVLKKEFNLILFPEIYGEQLKTKPVKGIYYSTDFPKLRVVDKENGGKADALNAGINLARSPLVCTIDSDSVLARDSLSRIIQPFLADPSTVAVGGQVRILNGCEVRGGNLVKIGLPKSILALFQIVEYMRAFLFGRLGWSRLNAIMIISGTFGVFDRDVLLQVGGYRTDTVGEDMELVLRIHRTMQKEKRKYRIAHVPDPICWTEVPEDLKTLASQRIRWQRGLAESLFKNAGLLTNLKGGAISWLAFPFWMIFEFFAPVIEVGGLVFLLVAFFKGFLSLQSLLVFLLVAYSSGMVLSLAGLLLEEISFHLYKDLKSILILFAIALLETPVYRIFISVCKLIGLFGWLFGVKGRWGKMKRKTTPGKPEPVPAAPQNEPRTVPA